MDVEVPCRTRLTGLVMSFWVFLLAPPLPAQTPGRAPYVSKDEALLSAVEKRDETTALSLIKSGIDVNRTVNSSGYTILVAAIDAKLPKVVQALIDKEADTEVSVRGYTPLMFAAAKGHDECAVVLIKGRAKTAVQSPEGFTPLILAARSCGKDVVSLLLNSNARVGHQMPDGTNALLCAMAREDKGVVAVLRKAGQ